MKLRASLAIRVLLASLSVVTSSLPVAAAESRGFVVTWFYPAMNSQEGDCGPDGINPRGDKLFESILRSRNLSDEQIRTALKDAPDSYPPEISRRGRIEGKPVNVYLNPTSEPDPHIKTARGTAGYGFNLDGKVGPDDFVEVETGEHGIDNMLARVVGCFESFRGTATQRPSYPAGHWAQPAEQMPAWLIQVSGVDDWRNDDDVQVSIFRARQPIVRGLTGEPIPDMTFQVDANPNSWNVMHGRIHDGVLLTEPIHFKMIGDPYGVSYYDFQQARLRLTLAPDNTVTATLGGYFDWLPLYMNFAIGGAKAEATLSVDVPGMYYALRRYSRTDPASGRPDGISAAYRIEAIPAFLIPPPAAAAATTLASDHP